jgi:hypothetical protein
MVGSAHIITVKNGFAPILELRTLFAWDVILTILSLTHWGQSKPAQCDNE